MKRFKGIVLGLVCLIVIINLLVTWLYPFSLFSVHKSYTYTPDSAIVDNHVKQRSYLLDCIKNMSSLEETIAMIKNDKWESRSTEKRIFHNLQNSFNSSFTLFASFYELSIHK